jgi:hypothetical protein
MAHADERALASLKRSALITRAFGLANPFFDGGRDRAAALFARFCLYVRAIEREEQRLAWHRRRAARRAREVSAPD